MEISVIMGVYNPESIPRFLEAVRSVARQSFRDWELLLYDDGSAAGYAADIERAAGLDERITLLRGGRNRGLAHALNACIQRAGGRYIARMDDDDFSKPERLEKQYRFLETHPQYQWVGSTAELKDAEGIWGLLAVPEIPQAKDFLWNSPYIHPSVLFRKEALVHSGGYNASPAFLQCEDYELFMRLHSAGGRGYNFQQPLLQYWEDGQSYKKRTYRRRIREMRTRYRGFRQLGLLNAGSFPYVLKPLLAGAVPPAVRRRVRRRLKYRGKGNEA